MKKLPGLWFCLCAVCVNAAEFEPEGGILTLDAIAIGDQYYHASMRHAGQAIFKLEQAGMSGLEQRDAYFNPDSGRINIPEVAIDGKDNAIPVELYLLDNGTFMATGLVSSGGKTYNYNREANVPPMCYTRTESRYNPCYTCHQNTVDGVGHENRMDDGNLQGDYTFSDVAMINRWQNLFVDRSAQVAEISDEEIMKYIHEDNYSGLAPRLHAAEFDGWIPDLENLHDPNQAFSQDGFAMDGSAWVAFNYKPLPSTFWPTNGSTDDVMIRLPESFRRDQNGSYVKDIYLANLAIVEAAIKNRASISVPALDEKAIGYDLDQDGKLGISNRVVRPQHYLGEAAAVEVVTFLYPEGTEFLHTVRYVGMNSSAEIYNAPRMKEVRYMKKFRFYKKPIIGGFYAEEQFEKEQGHYPFFSSTGDSGLDNGFGWLLQGFIENENGELRSQNYEETFFCMGCHSTIGSTIDKVFSFARKIDGAEGWGYIELKGMPDVPAKGEQDGEILNYLRLVGGGDEFRQNREMIAKWFKPDGMPDEAKITAAKDVYELITPSRERALELNKAYRVIVREQSYIRGRDASVTPATNVMPRVDIEIPPLPGDKTVKRDIRLDWGK